MQKSDIRILIIEDDPSLGKATEEALKRHGYATLLVNSDQAALNAVKLNDFYGMVVDCMLPKRSGVEVAKEIVSESTNPIVTILTSGIYKDKSFAHDAKVKTGAKTFLLKPYNLELLLSEFDQAFSHLIEVSREPLIQLLAKEQYSPRDRINAINCTEHTSAYDLPLAFAMLMDNKISGELHIKYDEKAESVVAFHNGNITKVIHPDVESYFGALLIEKGFTSIEELDAGLSQNNQQKPIGERLVENSSLSPHAIEIVQHEQMIIRLSKMISDTSVKINFVEISAAETSSSIDSVQFSALLSDWINSKIPDEWLKSFYNLWSDCPILKGPDYSKINLVKNAPAAIHFAKYLDNNEWPNSLTEILSGNNINETDLLRGLHYFLSQRIFVFGAKNKATENFTAKISRLNKINESFENKNYFEILGLNKNARPSEINRSYIELAKSLHPDKLSPQSPKELHEIAQKVFSKITDAYQVVSVDAKRAQYLKTLELGFADEIMKAESSFEDGVRLLKSSQFREARKSFERTMKLKGHRSDTILYMVWAYIKEKRHKSEKKELYQKVKMLLEQIAHEDRHSATYFFIKGMNYELSGNIQKAYQSLKHCLVLDPTFTDARKELSFIKQKYSTKTNSFSDDLSVVITKLFKKKVG